MAVEMETAEKKTMKQKVAHEFQDLAIITGYLGFFFCALATYSMLLLEKFNISYFVYGTALLNALVVAKVILIGEALHAGKKFERKALFFSALWKALVYSVLVLAFHFVEEMVKELFHGKSVAETFHSIRLDDLISRSVIVFCAFIPLFAFRELRRLMGDKDFMAMLFRSGAAPKVSTTDSH
jgi:hypothetical protein